MENKLYVVQIYCNEMDGAHPKEYLTLVAGDGDNYSEVYDKRFALYNVFNHDEINFQ